MKIPLPFPSGGVNLDAPVGEQPPGTVRNAKNVTPKDPISRRSRGAQRAGTRRFLNDPLGPGPAIDIGQVVTDVPRVTWLQCGESEDSPIVTDWSVAPEFGHQIMGIEVDPNGAPYVLNAIGGVFTLNQMTGETVRSFTLPGLPKTGTGGTFIPVDRLKFDEQGAIFVCETRALGAPTDIGGRIHRFRRVGPEQNYYSLQFTINIVNRQIRDFDVRFGVIALVGPEFGGAGATKLIRYAGAIGFKPDLMWEVDVDDDAYRVAIGSQGAMYVGIRPGIGAPGLMKYRPSGDDGWTAPLTVGGVGAAIALLPNNDIFTCGPKDGNDVVARKVIDLGSTYSTAQDTQATAQLTLTLAGTDGETLTVGLQTYTLRTAATLENEVTIGATPDLTVTSLMAAINHDTPVTYGLETRLNGDVVASQAANILGFIAKVGGTDGNAIAIFSTIAGATLNVFSDHLEGGLDDGDGAWARSETEDLYGGAVRPVAHITIDANGDPYYPVKNPGLSRQVEKRGGAHGYVLWKHRYSSVGEAQVSFAIGTPPFDPIYHTRSVTGPRGIFVGTSVGASPRNPVVYKLRTVEARANAGASAITRRNVYFGVSNGSVITFERGGTPTIPTGGTNALEPTSPYISSCQSFGKVFWIDGTRYVVYDPEGFDETPRRDKVETWTATGAGRIPEHARLICAWGSRIVLARFTDDPQNWAMSKRGDPYDWEFFPTVSTAADAIAGNDSRQDVCPDIVNALIPYSDDLLIIGGDHSMHRMTGDPGAGGYFDLITDTTGISFGSPWCKDPSGVLYFFGSRGGVYAMAPGGTPFSITQGSIESELLAIDLAAFKVRMAWDTQLDCLRIFFISFNADGNRVKHWFWQRDGGWWPVEFSSPVLEPMSLAILDGDAPDDRVVAFGCADGRVRVIDPDAVSDDGYRIESLIDIGPLAPAQAPAAIMLKGLQAVMASDQNAVRYQVFVGDSPENMEAQTNGILQPGQNPISRIRKRGNYVMLRLFNGASSERWAVESLVLEAIPMGRKRAESHA